jgi:hypothetical protein
MMLDRLQVADLKDEIVSMQMELNTVLFENQQTTQATQETPTIKTEPLPPVKNHLIPTTVASLQQQQPARSLPSMIEPSQILKAKQEQKLFENIKNERIKVENEKDNRKNLPQSSPASPQQSTKAMSKFDKLKNESSQVNSPQQPPPSLVCQSSTLKLINELKDAPLKDELDDFDIESEIRSNFIMKKCEPSSSPAPPALSPTSSTSKKSKVREREFSPLSDYLNTVKMELVPSKSNKGDAVKSELQDGAYDEWLSLQKELNLELERPKRKEIDDKKKNLDTDLSDIFDHHSSPKSVEKQLDDLFSSTSKSSDLLGAAASPSGLNELFHVEPTTMSEKTVENRLEALFGQNEDGKVIPDVESRLEQLFQGSVNANDESALDNASFLYKNPDLTYDMIQKQVTQPNSTSNSNASNANKRQWNSGNSCDIFSSSNVFPSSPSSSKRACTAPSVSFDDNKWIDDSFDFGSDINIPTEVSNDGMQKREWNGIIEQHPQFNQPPEPLDPQNLMDTSQIYEEDVDDISRQVQNAIDSILNLQSSDPLHYQLDSSFLELNAITSSSPNSPINHVQNMQSNQYPSMHQPQPQAHHFTPQNATKIAPGGLAKQRKYSRMEDIGDCLIGGSNLDDSPSALSLTLSDSHGEGSSASVGEFVNNLLNCDEKSISTS